MNLIFFLYDLEDFYAMEIQPKNVTILFLSIHNICRVGFSFFFISCYIAVPVLPDFSVELLTFLGGKKKKERGSYKLLDGNTDGFLTAVVPP